MEPKYELTTAKRIITTKRKSIGTWPISKKKPTNTYHNWSEKTKLKIFLKNRNTNANAESFNSKIKGFRANLRGVTDVKFFFFRLEKLFAR